MNSFTTSNILTLIIGLCCLLGGAIGSLVAHVIYNRVQRSKRKKVYASVPSLNSKAVTFKTQKDANAMFNILTDRLWIYGFVSVADLYDLVGTPANHKDNKYGWTDIKGAYITKAFGGYRLNLPKVTVLGDVERKYEQRI